MDLLTAATQVRLRAYAPYSKFLVGAAIRSTSGNLHTGCNVENVLRQHVGTSAHEGEGTTSGNKSKRGAWASTPRNEL